jgi:hypothetical protein
MNIDVKVPDYSTLSRRAKTVVVKLPTNATGELTILLDSSGLKVYGEGEWKVRQHGYNKHRTWRKIHLAITPNGELQAADLTTNSIDDASAGVKILDQIDKEIIALAADGAYDRRKIYDKVKEKQISQVLIPPQTNAKIWQHGNYKSPPHPRDANLRQIRKTSRSGWKRDSGYHVRSLVETAMFRWKTTFGDKLEARLFNRQRTEALIKASILNKMQQIGLPQEKMAD